MSKKKTKKYYSPKTNSEKSKPKSKKSEFQQIAEMLEKCKSAVIFDEEQIYCDTLHFRLSFPMPTGVIGSVDPKDLVKVAKLIGDSEFSAVSFEGKLCFKWGEGSSVEIEISESPHTKNKQYEVLGEPFNYEEFVVDFLQALVVGGMAVSSKTHSCSRLNYVNFSDVGFRASDGISATEAAISPSVVKELKCFKIHFSAYHLLRKIDDEIKSIDFYDCGLLVLHFTGCSLTLKHNYTVKGLPGFRKFREKYNTGNKVKLSSEFWKILKEFSKEDRVYISNGKIECMNFSLSTKDKIFEEGSDKFFKIKPKNLLKAKNFVTKNSEFDFYSHCREGQRLIECFLTISDLNDDFMFIAGNTMTKDGEYEQCQKLDI